jgi:hypothetical protein
MNNTQSASNPKSTTLDRILARVCVNCPVCRRARRQQGGVAFQLVKRVETKLCPFCRAYERVHGRQSHEPVANSEPNRSAEKMACLPRSAPRTLLDGEDASAEAPPMPPAACPASDCGSKLGTENLKR